jgi:hypothetical protein
MTLCPKYAIRFHYRGKHELDNTVSRVCIIMKYDNRILKSNTCKSHLLAICKSSIYQPLPHHSHHIYQHVSFGNSLNCVCESLGSNLGRDIYCLLGFFEVSPSLSIQKPASRHIRIKWPLSSTHITVVNYQSWFHYSATWSAKANRAVTHITRYFHSSRALVDLGLLKLRFP